MFEHLGVLAIHYLHSVGQQDGGRGKQKDNAVWEAVKQLLIAISIDHAPNAWVAWNVDGTAQLRVWLREGGRVRLWDRPLGHLNKRDIHQAREGGLQGPTCLLAKSMHSMGT